MATTHLAHKLPWGSVAEIAALWPLPGDPTYHRRGSIQLTHAQKKKIDHFARCFVSALREFQASDRSSDQELLQFDPRQWRHQREYGAGAWPGFYDTLLSGYVILKLILYDPTRFVARFAPNGNTCERIENMLGYYDGGHSEELARHLQQAFDINRLKPLTAEVTQVLRDHAALLFRCMLSISGENGLLREESVSSYVCWNLRVDYVQERTV